MAGSSSAAWLRSTISCQWEHQPYQMAACALAKALCMVEVQGPPSDLARQPLPVCQQVVDMTEKFRHPCNNAAAMLLSLPRCNVAAMLLDILRCSTRHSQPRHAGICSLRPCTAASAALTMPGLYQSHGWVGSATGDSSPPPWPGAGQRRYAV